MSRVDFQYTVIRKPRRSVTLSISRDSHITVTVPKNFSENKILQLLDRQAVWIEKKIRHNQKLTVQYPAKKYQSGDVFLYLGQPYRLEVIESETRAVRIEDSKLRVFVSAAELYGEDSETLASIVRAWYEGMAAEILRTRVTFYEARMQIKSGPIKVRTLERQWGSCGISGILCFNARLLMAPLEVVDYVVVHELSHLTHHNHSSEFWDLVESIAPDFRARRKWLREHGNFLNF